MCVAFANLSTLCVCECVCAHVVKCKKGDKLHSRKKKCVPAFEACAAAAAKETCCGKVKCKYTHSHTHRDVCVSKEKKQKWKGEKRITKKAVLFPLRLGKEKAY